jgi:isopentenyldiphosphate isomerase
MSEQLIQIVDEYDVPIRGGTMDEVQFGGLWHRIVRVMCVDGEGNYLLQKRGLREFTSPGCWDVSVSGHVDDGESYLVAALREAGEEIRLRMLPIELTIVENYKSSHTGRQGGVDRTFNRFNRTYLRKTPMGQRLRHNDEVEELRWVSEKSLRQLAENREKTTDALRHFVGAVLL